MTNRHYHGTRDDLARDARIVPSPDVADADGARVLLASDLDEAIWSAELAARDGPARVYVVEATGAIAPLASSSAAPRPHPSMSLASRAPLRVVSEVTEWTHYHGTRADLRVGDLLEAGRVSNFGATPRIAGYVYFTRTLDAAAWGAELAVGEGRGRIYTVEPTGPIEDDPNLTNKRFRGNPTRSYRSRSPLRITGEVTAWRGHAPELIAARKAALERLQQLGLATVDD